MTMVHPRFDARAKDVTFDEHYVVVELADGRAISIPLAWFTRLFTATPEQRANWEITSNGSEVRWPDLEEGFTVEAMLAVR